MSKTALSCGGAGESEGNHSGHGPFTPPAAPGPVSGGVRLLHTDRSGKARCVRAQPWLALGYEGLRKAIECTLLKKCPR